MGEGSGVWEGDGDGVVTGRGVFTGSNVEAGVGTGDSGRSSLSIIDEHDAVSIEITSVIINSTGIFFFIYAL
ncbi:MAG TPA: hypothetical protein PLP30_00045 [Clostridia bacterium]|nr:hypothetical protein [Clostridia bacterium]